MQLSTENLFLRNELISILLKHEGLKESKDEPNRGPFIDPINKFFGIPLGNPYCIGGLLFYGVRELCALYDLKNPIPMTASTQKFFKKCKEQFPEHVHLTESDTRFLKADICIQQTLKDPTRGHAYILTEDEKPIGTHFTFEMNTNKGGSRNGDGNYRLTRKRNDVTSKKLLGAVDVISIILEHNPNFKI